SLWCGRGKRPGLAFRQGAGGSKFSSSWSRVSLGTGPCGSSKSLFLDWGRRRKKRGCLRLERANIEWNRRRYCRGRNEYLFQIASQKDPPNSKNRKDANCNRDQK